ncbi:MULTISPECIES: hypothetical protein [Mycobacterium avium complex (MAC)]|uniref:hypothetical protein n=1 Tax=Mycobacterium avium TaxID=1764 RepID=UPI000AE44017|nr:hypothetical protein [Mycobacterium avium]MDO2354336.1 hypothetical protein [Mycobacterium avium subsp. hominissuis]
MSSGSPDNLELCWKSTQEMLHNLYSGGPASTQIHDLDSDALPPARDDDVPPPDEEYDEPCDAGLAGVEDTEEVADGGRAGEHSSDVPQPLQAPPDDLAAPIDAGEQPSVGDDNHSAGALPGSSETLLPGSDLVDALTHPGAADDNTDTAAEATRTPRYNKRIAAGFAGATAVATVVVTGALLAMRSTPHTTDPDHPAQPNTRLSVVAAPPSTTPTADNQDSAIPYTATSVGCLPGSTAAQSVAGPDSTQAWVCVTGGNVGQYLVLNLGRSMVVTAVSITPGWVGADASGADQWHQHRVLTRVQWSFNDTPPTVVPQETGSVHGEATKPMPARGVLASRIILLVQETGRAPADTTPTTTPAPGGGGGLIGEVLGPPAAPAEPTPTSSSAALPGLPADQAHTDPADNTFAVSSIKIFGHPPQ